MKKFAERIIFLGCIAVIWEIIYCLKIFPESLFPSIKNIIYELVRGFVQNELLFKTLNSLRTIFWGMLLGIVLAVAFMVLSQINSIFNCIVDNLVLFLNAIPSIAILPLCILWFGIGKKSILFIMVHSVIWVVLTNMLAGIHSIPQIYKEIGLNLELNKFRIIKDIYMPSCLPYFISGIKLSFARAWRTAVSVELLVGVVDSNAGLGWYMTYQRSTLNIAGLFSVIIVITIVNVVLEDVLFKMLENWTVRKWGMIK